MIFEVFHSICYRFGGFGGDGGDSNFFLWIKLRKKPQTLEYKNTGEDQFHAITKWLSPARSV